jgi:hypothetical protein
MRADGRVSLGGDETSVKYIEYSFYFEKAFERISRFSVQEVERW